MLLNVLSKGNIDISQKFEQLNPKINDISIREAV